MVRQGYRLSETIEPLPIFSPDKPPASLVGFRDFPENWAIDWNLFIDLEKRPAADSRRMQRAYRIDTSLVNPLANLPLSITQDRPPMLAHRNLLRSWRLGLPSGQAVARAMGLVPRPDEQILFRSSTGDSVDIKALAKTFVDNCPLWTYVLAETVEEKDEVLTSDGDGVVQTTTRRLGPVGGRIVAETIVGLLEGDPLSYLSLDPLWHPPLANAQGQFGLRELIKEALKV
jgi:hypothetical protein